MFNKATSCLSGPNDPVVIPRGSRRTDWEVELALVIGTGGHNISETDALAHVAGYTIVNDVSERRWQVKRGGQWVKGKSAPTFGPIGPWLVTADEVPEPQALDLWLDVNGTRVQSSNTKEMIFGCAFIISYLSEFLELLPGDVITTGTPDGIGMSRQPPRFLTAGDTMTLSVAGLGEQSYPVVAHPDDSRRVGRMTTAAGRTVLITGAAGGLGAAMTTALVEADATVIATDRDEAGLRELAEHLDATGQLHIVTADISTEAGRRELLGRCAELADHVDGLINNAGIGLTVIRPDDPVKPIRYWDVDSPTLELFLAVHTVAPYHLTNALLPAMIARGWGRIVTVTTSLATMIRRGMSPYGGAKAATEAFTALLAADLVGTGVTANVLIPGGPVDTAILPDRPEIDRSRWLRPSVMGPPAVWLVSPAADHVNGQRVVAAECDPHTGAPSNLRGIAWPGHEGEVHWRRP